jgi:UDP-N-acetylmuramoyl-L-alanyl-D-glutamate--2,6-diaminopimelate ligase
MLNTFKNWLRPLLPQQLMRLARPWYHGAIALWATAHYGFPSRQLIVIGITGTTGKSSTVNLLAQILQHAGYKTGFITTTNYSLGDGAHSNTHGMSMPGGDTIQKQLRAMVHHGCTYAIVECTSEGLAQNRHLGINFDVALFTNLSPAHLDAHGGFANYKKAKLRLFKTLARGGKKSFFKKTIIGVNLDDSNVQDFLAAKAGMKFGITTQPENFGDIKTKYHLHNIVGEPHTSFALQGVDFHTQLVGSFNAYNAALAAACADQLGVSLQVASQALRESASVPGRMEFVPNNRGLTIIVDYSPEPAASLAALTTAKKLRHERLIHVFGSTGGSRDVAKRFEFGALSARHADVVIITNDDVYDSDPEVIARDVATGINQVPETERSVQEVETVLDRRAAIARALAIARTGDLVLVAGKGSEKFLVLPGNERIPWDDVTVIKELLA